MSFITKLFFEKLRTLRNSRILANRNPRANISTGVIILGNPECITLGEGTFVEAGVVFDMNHGGRIDVGANGSIRRGAIISPYGGNIVMGQQCGVNHYTILYGHGGLVIGDFVRFAAHCLVIPANHGIKRNEVPINQQPLSKKGIRFGSDIWVGSGVQILDGVDIADGAVIAAGAVVTSSVPDHCIFGGVPAKLIKHRE